MNFIISGTMKIKLYILLIILCYASSLFAQINKLGNPLITNYTSKIYHANEQNWVALQDFRGVMYFGNTDGVLEYDGNDWTIIPVSNNSLVRSLEINNEGKIYVGAVNEFGYLEPDVLGKIKYKSLSNQLSNNTEQFADIWRIYATNNDVYFCSFTKIFLYSNDTLISIIDLPEESMLSYFWLNRIFTANTSQGLLELEFQDSTDQTTFKLLPGSDFYAGKYILSFIPIDSTNVFLGTFGNGIFKFNIKTGQSTLIEYSNQKLDASAYIKKNSLFHSLQMTDGSFAIGTYQKGLVISDSNGQIHTLVDKNNFLQDEIVTYTYFPKSKRIDDQLWITLARGITKIDINSPFRFFNDETNINDIITFNNILYLATDNGVNFLNFTENGLPEFKALKDAKGQSWSFLNFIPDNKSKKNSILLGGISSGIISINKSSVKIISDKYDCRILYQSKHKKNTIYVGYNGGLATLSYTNNIWTDEGAIEGFIDNIVNIAEDSIGNIWLGTYYNGIIKIDITDTTLTRFGEKDGLPSNKENKIYNIDNKLVIATNKGFYKFNSEIKKFIPNNIFGEKYANGSTGIYRLYKNSFDEYFFIAFKQNIYSIIKVKESNNTFVSVEEPFKRLPNMSYQSIYTDDNHITWIGGADGLYSYNSNYSTPESYNFNSLIRKVIIGQDSVIFNGTFYEKNNGAAIKTSLNQPDELVPVLAYTDNSISFDFAAAFYIDEEKTQFSHKLHGFNKSWTKWNSETKAVFTNLYEGEYSFEVKAKNIYDRESTIARFNFKITPPWYRTILAYLSYIILFIFSIRFLIKYNTRRLEKEKQVLERIVKRRTAEVVKQKEEIEKAYENVKMLSEIGQNVTTNLSVERIVEVVYQNVNKLMDASIFAIAIYDDKNKTLEFLGKESTDGPILRNTDSIDNKELLSSWCFINQNEIIINNFSKDNSKLAFYENDNHEIIRESFIYLPLTTKENKIGIITVQSYEKNAYSDFHLNILKNLAIYTAIALDNAEAYEQIESQKNEIERQRDIVIKQKEEIMDSILYAKRIQNAVLPPEEIINSTLPEHFVLFKPRDIVSGDFYWMKQINNFIVVTVADCTGHGVPGAFMSMLGIALLNEIVRKKTVTTSGQILNHLKEQVKLSLRQTGKQDEAKDGMDISLCIIDIQNKTINFSGAYNSLYLVRNKKHIKENASVAYPIVEEDENYAFIEVKADKMPIGIHLKEMDSFTDHHLNILTGDTIYLYTDGYADQFGGASRKKFMTKPFKKLLLSIQDEKMKDQKIILDNKIEEWKKWPNSINNEYEQIDDITVLGIRF